jgi:predicted RNA-binding Zn-ribbon protein involved in translation (DUF1610 family)
METGSEAFAQAFLSAAKAGDDDRLSRLRRTKARCSSCGAVADGEDAIHNNTAIVSCPNCGEIWLRPTRDADNPYVVRAIKVTFVCPNVLVSLAAGREESFLNALLSKWIEPAIARLDGELGPDWCFESYPWAVVEPMRVGVDLVLRDEGANAVHRIKAILKQSFESCVP